MGVFESFSDWTWEVDVAGVYTHVSPGVENVLGYKPEEVVGKTPFDFMPPDEATRVAEIVKGIAGRGGPIIALKNIGLHKDGRCVILETNGAPILNEDRKIIGYRGIDRDITDRKRAEDELRESNAKHERLVNNLIETFLYRHDVEGVWTYVSSSVTQVLGYSVEESLTEFSRHLTDHPVNRLAARCREQSIKGIPQPPYELQIYHKDGSTRWLEVSETPVRDTAGNVVAVEGVAHNITSRKLAEVAMRRERDRAQRYLDIAGTIMVALDREGRVTLLNKKGCEILGVTLEEAMGVSWFDRFIPERARGRITQVFADIMAGHMESVEYYANVVLASQGEERTIAWHNSALRDEEGVITGLLASGDDITDRHRAAEELRRSEERLRILFESSADAAFLTDLDGRIVQVNRQACRSTGYREAELMSLNIADIDANMSNFDERRANTDLLALGDITRVETTIQRKDGSTFPAEVAISHLDMPEGPRLMGMARDITERKRAEEALRESEAKLKAVLDNVGIGIALIDNDMRIQSLNRTMTEWFPSIDVHDSPICYMAYNDPPRNAPCPYCPTILTLADGEVHEAVTDTPVGEAMRHYRIVSSPILDAQGTVIAAIEMVDDITERKLMEKEVERQSYYLREAQRLGQIGTWDIDIRQNTIHWTKESCRIFGVPVGSVVNYEVFIERVHPDDRADVGQKWQAAIDGEPYDIEHRIVVDGVTKWVREKAEMKFDEEGSAISAIGIAQDITERKLMEEERASLAKFPEENPNPVLRLANDGQVLYSNPAGRKVFPNLSHVIPAWESSLETAVVFGDQKEVELRIGDRLFQLIFTPVADAGYVNVYGSDITERKRLEAQIYHSQKMDAIGQLAGGVAHDFNNLLGGITGYADLLKMDLLPGSPEANYAEEILTAASRAADLTQQLLTFSRRGRRQTLDVDMHSILDEVVALLQRSIDKSIDVVQQFEASPAVVSGDPAELQSAILNLAINARDAMPEGGQLTFSTRTILLDELYCRDHAGHIPPGLYLEIDVTDTGVGMDLDVQQHLFEPFFTTKEQGKGTGLGLASVYGCIKDHQGMIRVYSEPGQGSTFKILLPVCSEAVSVTAAVTETPLHGHGHILVIDDEEVVRRFTDSALTHLGYSVSCCCDGEEGVAFFHEHYAEVDLVILDMIMPRLSGEMVFHLLKEIDPDVRVLVASGFTQNRAAETVLDNGALGFLTKPFHVADLSREVARCLSDGT